MILGHEPTKTGFSKLRASIPSVNWVYTGVIGTRYNRQSVGGLSGISAVRHTVWRLFALNRVSHQLSHLTNNQFRQILNRNALIGPAAPVALKKWRDNLPYMRTDQNGRADLWCAVQDMIAGLPWDADDQVCTDAISALVERTTHLINPTFKSRSASTKQMVTGDASAK